MKLFHLDGTWRFKTLRIVLVLFCVGIAFRLFSIQLIEHGKYETLAARQHSYTREIIAERGKIFSADGTPLAVTQDAFLLYAVPPEITDVENVTKKLMEVVAFRYGSCILNKAFVEQDEKCTLKDEKLWESFLKEKQESLVNQLTQKDRLWIPIIRGLSVSQKDTIQALDLTGFYFEAEKKRVYPEKTLAAHVLGFVGSDEFGKPTGYFGIEGYYNGELSGTHGGIHMEVDASGKPIPIGEFEPVVAKPGLDITLTIKRELQYMLDKIMVESVEKHKANFGNYILMDPKSGQVWAMGNAPTFDPGNWVDFLGDATDVAKVNVFKNSAISDNYEPGSVMKAFTVSVALENGLVTPDTIYYDNGPITVQGYQIKTWNEKYAGPITTAQILQLSNNPGAATIGMNIGYQLFWDNLHAFGFGEHLSIGLQGEEQGLLKPENSWRDIDVATAAFGQGLAVTPLQLVSMMATIANNGEMMQPYVVSKMVDPSTQEEINFTSKSLGQRISPEVSKIMRSLLQQVVEHGEFQWFVERQKLENYAIAGKTGTAQIPVSGGYDPNKTNVTFVGFVPQEDPAFVLLVRLNQPRTSTFSADTAVPVWLEMTRQLITYFGIPPR